MSKRKEFEYWIKIKLIPWIKKNKIPLVVILLSIGFMCIFLWGSDKPAEKKNDKKKIYSESTEEGVSGKDVKKLLSNWKESDHYAIIVAEANIMLNQTELFETEQYSTLFMNNQKTDSVQINNKPVMLWGINYGSILKDDVVIKNSDSSYYTVHGLMKKNKKTKFRDLESEKIFTKTVRAKTNKYTKKSGILIPDEEKFKKVIITNRNGDEIGCAFIPDKAIVK